MEVEGKTESEQNPTTLLMTSAGTAILWIPFLHFSSFITSNLVKARTPGPKPLGFHTRTVPFCFDTVDLQQRM